MESLRLHHPLLWTCWYMVTSVFRMFNQPDQYDHGNLAMVLRPENKKSDMDFAPMTFPYWSIDADIAHEVII